MFCRDIDYHVHQMFCLGDAPTEKHYVPSVPMSERKIVSMSPFPRMADRLVGCVLCLIRVTLMPKGPSQMAEHGNADVLGKLECVPAMLGRVKQRRRALQMRQPGSIITVLDQRTAEEPVTNDKQRRLRPGSSDREKLLRLFERRACITADESGHPQSPENREFELCLGVPGAVDQLASATERIDHFRMGITVCRHQGSAE